VFLLGVDLVKDESTLTAAYDDEDSVTAAFNLNVLRRLNDELHADFDLTGFQHSVCWNPIESRVEMHLESMRSQRVRIPAAGLDLRFRAGETISY
jgi:L-histidine Nalpha-methyltransferase